MGGLAYNSKNIKFRNKKNFNGFDYFWLYKIKKIGWKSWVIYKSSLGLISIYVIEMSIIKCEKVFAGIFTLSSLFEIKMKIFSYRA